MNILNFSAALEAINVNRDIHGFALPSCTKGIYFYKGRDGLAVRVANNDEFAIVSLDSLTAEYLLSYGVRGELEICSLTSLRTKDQFDKLSIENKETVMFFLSDRFTEDNVWIKLNEDGSLHSVYESNECELKETIHKQEYIDKDVLLYILS